MKIVRFSKDSYQQKSYNAMFYSGIDYLLHDRMVLECEQARIMSGFDLLETLPFSIKNWQYPEPCDNLLVYVTGRTGDMLWLTAVFRRLKELRPRMLITVVTSYPAVFEGNKDVTTTRFVPLPLDAIKDFDGCVILDEPVAGQRGVLQKNCYQILFEAFGLPWQDGVMVPNLHITKQDEESAFARIVKPDSSGEMWSTEMHLVLGLHSASRARNLPPIFWKRLVARFNERFGTHENFHIYGFSDDDFGARIQEQLVSLHLPNYTPAHARLGLKEIAAIVRTACCVISVDTMFIHLAAAMGTACVPLMTTVPPNVRVSTYPLARPIWKGSACPYAPCFWKESNFRLQIAERIEILPCYTPTREYCDIGTAITTDDVMEHFDQATGARQAQDNFYFPPLPTF